MARYRSSALVSALSGCVGGVEFAQGKTSGTVKSRRRNNRSRSQAQLAASAALVTMSHAWDTQTQLFRDAWSTFAAVHPRSNGLGQIVGWTGKQACTQYHLSVYDWLDRTLPGWWYLALPPSLTATAPRITYLSAAFTQGGPYNIDCIAWSGGLSREVLYAARRGNGSRGGCSNMRFIGAQTHVNNTTTNWYSFFTRAGTDWELQTGEVVEIRIHCMGYTALGWPNMPWSALVTVA